MREGLPLGAVSSIEYCFCTDSIHHRYMFLTTLSEFQYNHGKKNKKSQYQDKKNQTKQSPNTQFKFDVIHRSISIHKNLTFLSL
uniref:Uncharacterized protein n=1 Tax=Echeneis naucrates TaxID=173247 RepID=A0A665U091_ECHNA